MGSKKRQLASRPATAPTARTQPPASNAFGKLDVVIHKTAPGVLSLCAMSEGETTTGLMRVDQLTVVLQTHMASMPPDLVQDYVVATSAHHVVRTDNGARVKYPAWVKERGAAGRAVGLYHRAHATTPINDLRTRDDVLDALDRLGFEKMSDGEQRRFVHQLVA